MCEGRNNIPCTRLEDELRETVGRVRCKFCVVLLKSERLGEKEDQCRATRYKWRFNLQTDE